MINRERKVDVNQLPPEQVDQLSIQIGDKVRGIVDEAADKVNALLKVYGLSAKIALAFETAETPETAPKKRGRKPKQ